MSLLKQYLLNLDVRLGGTLNLQHTAYTAETILTDGQGAYTREEWTKARRAGYNQTGSNARELDTESGFLRRAFGVEQRKMLSGLRMAAYLEAWGTPAVLEVGCGEMVTAWAIKSCLPGIRYLASDYDDFIVEKCRRLPILQPLEKQSLDVNVVTAEFLQDFPVVIAWDVFYSFETARLIDFLLKIKSAASSLVVCSSQIIGPMRALSYLVKSRGSNYAARCQTGRLRAHGYKCSPGYYRALAKQLDMGYELVSLPPLLSAAGDNYCFIKISSRGAGAAPLPT